MARIALPQNLSLTEAINFCNRLWETPSDTRYEFDFHRMGMVEPFTMAYVANELKRFRRSREEAHFTALNFHNHTYPAHMGFFQAFGLKHGNAPGQASGSSTYIPLTLLNVAGIESEAAERAVNPGDVIEEKAAQIAQLLVRQAQGSLVDTLTFSIREIMRNVVEHSGSEFIEYCGQYWPSRNMVEVAILDVGNGVRYGLRENPYLNITCDRDALHLALLPGVSGKMYRGVRRRPNDAWQNSGFGLYMTSRICRAGGSFFIASNGAGIILDSAGKQDRLTSYQGTALRLRFNTQSLTNHDEMLARFRRQGYEAARQFAGDQAIEPSLASTMLARDFQTS
ncbi:MULTISPECIES: hypothetical protein [unclassified Pseudomonas]|uniref:hypothetical protein n=1 Tax=unclassified Pseudomonas TaxID=196821 RepID=UPI0008637C4E|nr:MULTISPECIES: hypothetical protein [unclassified Pseudomonas]PIK80035.1 hypothetical protein CQW31_04425 [Pseudomonas sp. 382]